MEVRSKWSHNAIEKMKERFNRFEIGKLAEADLSMINRKAIMFMDRLSYSHEDLHGSILDGFYSII